MRALVKAGACAALLAGPTVLAFFSGGYFDAARNWAGLVAWALVVVAVIVSPNPFPRRTSGRVAVIGLALFAAWTLLSFTWAPVAGNAYHAGQRVFLYVGVLVAAVALLQGQRAQRVVEPALTAGALIVVSYGISERLLPGLLHFQHSLSAEGRLEQPLTYWNAMGELAALGCVLCIRMMGDATRQVWLRCMAAFAIVPLALGLYLSFSRGALFAAAAGLVVLLVLAPRREQLQSIVLAVGAGVLTLAAAAPFSSVTALRGSLATKEQQGAIVLVLLVVIASIAALVQFRLSRERRSAVLRLPRRAPVIAVAAICLGLGIAIVAGAKEGHNPKLAFGASRFTTLQSDRYAYWGVALRAFGDQPLRGVGAGGWAAYWLRYRPFNGFASDAHSLPLQTAAELGVVGLALLAMFLAGVGLAARDALKAAPVLAAGPIAGFVTYIAHSPLDWDWQMPALTLVGILLAGAVIAQAQPAASDTDDEAQTASGAYSAGNPEPPKNQFSIA